MGDILWLIPIEHRPRRFCEQIDLVSASFLIVSQNAEVASLSVVWPIKRLERSFWKYFHFPRRNICKNARNITGDSQMAKKTQTETVSIRFSSDQIKYLKRLSHTLSLERDENIQYSDLIREAVELQFPVPPMDNEDKDNGSLNLQSELSHRVRDKVPSQSASRRSRSVPKNKDSGTL